MQSLRLVSGSILLSLVQPVQVQRVDIGLVSIAFGSLAWKAVPQFSKTDGRMM